jgi:hypothetical protein
MDILIKDENVNLPTLYWILNLHKNPYRERYIIGSSTNSTTKKHLFITRTEILFAVKSRLQLYCDKSDIYVLITIHIGAAIKCG